MKAGALVLVLFASSVVAYAQGEIQFINIGVGFNAPIYESDGVTPLSGPQFTAELLAGPSANNLASIAMTGFLTGAGYAGYFNAGVATVNGMNTFSTAWVQVRAWNTLSGSSFLQAQASGLPNSWWQSPTFTVLLGGPYSNGASPPAPLAGLGNSPVYLNAVPEPSVLALLGCSLAVGFWKKGLTTH